MENKIYFLSFVPMAGDEGIRFQQIEPNHRFVLSWNCEDICEIV